MRRTRAIPRRNTVRTSECVIEGESGDGHQQFNADARCIRGRRHRVHRDARKPLPRTIRSSRTSVAPSPANAVCGLDGANRTSAITVAQSCRCREASPMRSVNDLFGSAGGAPTSCQGRRRQNSPNSTGVGCRVASRWRPPQVKPPTIVLSPQVGQGILLSSAKLPAI